MKMNELVLEKNSFTNYDLFVSIYDSEIAKAFDLKPSSLLVLNGLSRYYNYKNGVVFPGIETLATHLHLSEKTVRTCILELVKKGLILKTKKRSHNVYCFTNLFWNYIKAPAEKSNKITNRTGNLGIKSPVNFTAKQNKDKQNKLTSSCKKNDDDFIEKNQDIKPIQKIESDQEIQINTTEDKKEYQELIIKLETLNITDAFNLISKYGVKKINKLLKFIEGNANIINPGAYLRKLLENNINLVVDNSNKQNKQDNRPLIKKLLQTDSSLTSERIADVVLSNSNQWSIKKDLELILMIQVVWNFNSNDYDILRYLESKKNTNAQFNEDITILKNELIKNINEVKEDLEKGN